MGDIMKIIEDITNFIFIQDEPQQADIIFIPGGSHNEPGEYAAKLWKEGYAPLIMPSGGISAKTGRFNGVKSKIELYSKDYKTEFEFIADVLVKNGVPENVIIKEDASTWTKENADFSRAAADKHGLVIKKAILCCKCFHSRRSFMFYQLAFPETDFYVYPVPYYSENTLITKENWYKTDVGISRVLGELQRCGSQFKDEFIKVKDSI
jgi:uncharacterized SAM-binding protein YcdF (DUF218 family)